MNGIQGVYPLHGVVQHYSWGGYRFIAQLLRQENSNQQPFAEYWLGAHPNHPSRIRAQGAAQPLDAFISRQPQAVLGAAYGLFAQLPFLLKILDVRQMLSIQVHPDKAGAEAGFRAEDEKGLARNAPERNYKDDNHKPEMMVALSEFWLLHGFKPVDQLRTTLEAVPEFEFLVGQFNEGGYEALYRTAMTLPQPEVNRVLQPVIDRIQPLYHNGELLKTQEDFWAARAAETYGSSDGADRGIFSIFLFNLVHLREGEGIYQGAGLPHAYLEGQNVELMANSDNVLRAGLTDKHIDVPELLRHVAYEPTTPQVLGSEAIAGVQHFSVPAAEFELFRYRPGSTTVAVTATGPEVLLLLEGAAQVRSAGSMLALDPGGAAFVPAGTAYTISGPHAVLFRAAVPKNVAPAQVFS